MHGGRSRSAQTTKSAQPASWHTQSRYHTVRPILHHLMCRLIEVVAWTPLKISVFISDICAHVAASSVNLRSICFRNISTEISISRWLSIPVIPLLA
jgi:hypothetical protein